MAIETQHWDALVHDWTALHDLDERVPVEFAAAAVKRLAELIKSQPALFQACRRGSERGAESLCPRPFQGVPESLQNGDDLGAATALCVGLRPKGWHRELMLAHDGDLISLIHVGAMVLPWVSTKAEDPAFRTLRDRADETAGPLLKHDVLVCAGPSILAICHAAPQVNPIE